MANEYYISAGLVPIDNSTGATANSYYISAGLVPNDTAAAGWSHKIYGLDPATIAKINGDAIANIAKVYVV